MFSGEVWPVCTEEDKRISWSNIVLNHPPVSVAKHTGHAHDHLLLIHRGIFKWHESSRAKSTVRVNAALAQEHNFVAKKFCQILDKLTCPSKKNTSLCELMSSFCTVLFRRVQKQFCFLLHPSSKAYPTDFKDGPSDGRFFLEYDTLLWMDYFCPFLQPKEERLCQTVS